MTIQVKRGLEENRLSYTPIEGELIYTTDTRQLYIGDGVTPGGLNILDIKISNKPGNIIEMREDGLYVP